MPTGAPDRWLGYAAVALFGGAMAYSFLSPRPGPHTPGDNPGLRCTARSVALQQFVYASMQPGTPAPDFLDELDARVNRLYRQVRSLTQSNDPQALAYRPIMIAEEAARDTAVASDPDAYLREAWVAVQACDTALNGELPA